MKLAKVLIAAASVISIYGCATVENAKETTETVYKDLDAASTELTAQRARPSKKLETVRYVDDQWVDLKPVKIVRKETFPDFRCRLKLRTNEPVSILEVTQIIIRDCGVNVRVTADAMTAIAALDDPNAGNAAPQTSSPGAPGPMPTMNASRNSQQPSQSLIDVTFNGELAAFLNMVTGRLGLQWKREGDKKATIFAMDTEVMDVKAIASATNMSSNIETGTTLVSGSQTGGTGNGSGNGSSSAGGITGTSGSNQRTTVTIATNIWAEINETLKTLKSPKGTFTISPGSGSVTMTDTEEARARARLYLSKLNTRLNKQITFHVKLASVQTSGRDQFGLSWEAVYNSISRKYGISLKSGNGPIEQAANGAFSILTGSDSPWAGTTALLSALAEQGDVSILRSPSASTLNLRPVSLQIAKVRTFLAGSTTTQTAQVGTSSSIQLGQFTYGLNMSFLPYAIDDDEMQLQFSINLSTLDNQRTVVSGDSTAEAIDSSMPINSTQQIKVKPGETIIVAGFEGNDDSATHKGTNTPGNLFLGGGVDRSSTRSALVLMITPVMD